MNTATSVETPSLHVSTPSARPRFDHKTGPVTAIIFVGLLAVGLPYTGHNPAMAWILTLPAAILLSGLLYWFFTLLF
jgi:hypothetical protein